MKPFNELTPAQAELLDVLAEECAEVIMAISKIKRHGYESFDPRTDGTQTNRDDLVRELGDVFAAIDLLVFSGEINLTDVHTMKYKKSQKIRAFLHHINVGGK